MATRIGWLAVENDSLEIDPEEGGYVVGAIAADRALANAHLTSPARNDDGYVMNADYGVPVPEEIEFEMASTYSW